jgi:hypothetical protein
VPTPAGSGESQALLSRVVAACCVTHDCTRHARLGFAMQAHLAAVAQTTRHSGADPLSTSHSPVICSATPPTEIDELVCVAHFTAPSGSSQLVSLVVIST